MAVQEQITPTAPVIVLEFQATNIPDAVGNAKAVEPSSNEYLLPWRGTIIGMSARSNAVFTGGTVTFRPTVDGTANTGISVTLDSTNQQASARKSQGAVAFGSGKRIGVDWTKTGTVAPTTNDVVITLFIILEDVFA